MVSQGVGGILLDSLHSALDTHGSSPFELNKQMINVTGNNGTSGNVAVRCETDWGRTITGEQFLKQITSDFGDILIKDADGLMSESLLSNLNKVISNSKNGRPVSTSSHESALVRLLLPLEILKLRLDMVDQLINGVVFHEISQAKINKPSLNLANKSDLDPVITTIKQRLTRMNVHGYLTYLSTIANNTIPRLSKSRLFAVIMAETLLENSKEVLTHDQNLSKGLWNLLAQNQLVIVAKESRLNGAIKDNILTKAQQQAASYKENSSLPILGLTTINATYRKQASDAKLWKQVLFAKNRQRLTTSSNSGKFGPSSSLAAFICADNFLKSHSQQEKQLIKDVHIDSSYRNYIQYTQMEQNDENLLTALQTSHELKVSVGVLKSFYPD
ncbi:hypothetical protein [Pseudoalteromonas denitrificans]|uniref:Uncharacterized protein n=1 Tax=Pseudoalteromonas denitrificans DSM 6059 TaxID=1123010 RepID=A0A1I1RKU7_9GAMM|nr:hypothetical protein [Pseudoalteromonas denitrificans]SFD34934.1 hypothetical protein SAMN02745724_04276 [Pseudoalteromonas denitrificans DSM 6059]